MGAETVRECVIGYYGLAYLSDYGGSGAGYIDDKVYMGVSEIQLAIIASYLLRK